MEGINSEELSSRFTIVKGNKMDQLAKSLLGTVAAFGLGLIIDKAYDVLIVDGNLKKLLSRHK